ncbi:MAG: hypothetical protein H6607_11565 [Flavobacteriales bacterium]|nr:hypothetical protein [Flavobacteriales bacterium]
MKDSLKELFNTQGVVELSKESQCFVTGGEDPVVYSHRLTKSVNWTHEGCTDGDIGCCDDDKSLETDVNGGRYYGDIGC